MSDLADILAKLHTGLAESLLQRIQSGEATASDLNVARQFLKDNGIDNVPKKDDPLANLAHAVPFTEADEDAEAGYLPN